MYIYQFGWQEYLILKLPSTKETEWRLYMNKFKNFLLNKGVYLVAIGCIALVSLSGLYIANVMDNRNNQEPQRTASSSDTDDQDVIALPTRRPDGEQPDSSPTPTGTPFVAPSPDAPANASPAPTATPTIQLSMPVNGDIIVEFAMDRLVYNRTLDEWRTHSGIDIAAPIGTEVGAAADGTVVDVKQDPRLGFLIIIEHTREFRTVYANLREGVNVDIGAAVRAGDTIGWVGRTAPFEFADGPHLHFEVLLNDTPVNPVDFINRDS